MKILKNLLIAGSALLLFACQKSGPQDFLLESDQCDNCKMTITDPKFATELITEKGRVYKFDDISCMTMFETSEADKVVNAKKYVIDYPSGKFLELQNAHLVTGGSIKSPMGGNTQAYENKAEAEKAAAALGADLKN